MSSVIFLTNDIFLPFLQKYRKMRRKKKIEKENTRKEEETMSEKNVAFTRDRSIPKSYELVLTALFTAIIVVMAFTPLGFIPLVVINATIIHIPVILS